MYLSRLILNPQSREVQRDLSDCQNMHRTVMSAFPQMQESQQNRLHLGVLYRVEHHARNGLTALLVQSRVEPDWSVLEPGYLLAMDGGGNPMCKSVDRPYQRISDGMVLSFRLDANPTKKIDTKTGSDGRRRHGKRVELLSVDSQLEWLKRKGLQGGFELMTSTARQGDPNARALRGVKVHGWHGTMDDESSAVRSGKMTFQKVTFEGLLKVTNAAGFRATLEKGIGTAKAYGFGLLSVASVRVGRGARP